jgi:hypothetical protein
MSNADKQIKLNGAGITHYHCWGTLSATGHVNLRASNGGNIWGKVDPSGRMELTGPDLSSLRGQINPNGVVKIHDGLGYLILQGTCEGWNTPVKKPAPPPQRTGPSIRPTPSKPAMTEDEVDAMLSKYITVPRRTPKDEPLSDEVLAKYFTLPPRPKS